jgi:hypothetical protein
VVIWFIFSPIWCNLSTKIWQPCFPRSPQNDVALSSSIIHPSDRKLIIVEWFNWKQLPSTLTPGLPDFSRRNVPKLGKNTELLITYQLAVSYSKWPKNIPTFFHLKALENLPKFGFLV